MKPLNVLLTASVIAVLIVMAVLSFFIGFEAPAFQCFLAIAAPALALWASGRLERSGRPSESSFFYFASWVLTLALFFGALSEWLAGKF